MPLEVVTCGGPSLPQGLKYEPITRRKHGLSDKTQGQTWPAQFWGQFLNYFGLGVALRVLSKHRDFRDTYLDGVATGNHSYWRGRYIGRAIPFFIERYEQETRKARLVVTPIPLLPYERITQIRVQVSPERSVTEDARFFFLQVKNTGEKTAEDVVPLLAVPQVWSSLTRLVIVRPTGDPFMSVEWSRTTDEFEHRPDRFAIAVIYDKNTLREPISLYGDGLACGFALFFTVKGSPGVYFPAEVPHGLAMPCHFRATLYFQAKDLPLFRNVAAYEVEASDWNSVKVTEIVQDQTSSHSRSLFRHKSSKKP